MKLSTKKHLFLVLHLCLVFTMSWSYLLSPWIHRRIAERQEQQLLAAVIGHESLFRQLPLEQQQQIRQRGDRHKGGNSLVAGMRHLLLDLSPYLRGFLFLSILICVLGLRGKSGVRQALWVLPLLLLLEATCSNGDSSGPHELFPSEGYVVSNYLEVPPHGSAREQAAQLAAGWERYLLAEWGGEDPVTALWHFNCARALTEPRATVPSRHVGPLMLLLLGTWTALLLLVVLSNHRRRPVSS